MAVSNRPLKGILKKPSTPAPDPEVEVNDDHTSSAVSRPATHSRRLRTEQDNAEIARKHAAIVQQRRDLEAIIFQNIETLTNLPVAKGPGISAANPAAEDIATFRDLVRIFQPGDYGDLIEERNTYDSCGYSLCPNKRRKYAGGGAWKLVNTGRKDFGIVARGELEKWCSDNCARRALYIKVQLNETAAWERVGIPDIQIDLMVEDAVKGEKEVPDAAVASEAALVQDLARLKLGEERRQAQIANALAMERGDASTDKGSNAEGDYGQPERIMPPRPSTLVDINIVEKKVVMVPTVPTLQRNEDTSSAGDDTSHLVVEGHKIQFASK
ncbi:hypothetical protein SEPCBS57363_003906 [Sporothrix epigloea]|uniref:RNA polymerase II subunit B1 CTD phosphatase RPAP2 homolog n=1 Tax=Sporothrix epigloea TaxID=1892477 RepID=A0ABP0DPE8_9PEZI